MYECPQSMHKGMYLTFEKKRQKQLGANALAKRANSSFFKDATAKRGEEKVYFSTGCRSLST